MAASDVANVLLKLLDIANPLAGTVAEFVAGKMGLSDKTVEAVQNVVSGADPVKLKQIAADLQDHLAQYTMQREIANLNSQAAQVDSINKTLQTEAMGGSFWQRNHHAFESSLVVCLVGAIYFGLPILQIAVPQVPESAWIMLGGILGATAWQRGAANTAIAAK